MSQHLPRPQRDPYQCLLESYIWRFSTATELCRCGGEAAVGEAVARILRDTRACREWVRRPAERRTQEEHRWWDRRKLRERRQQDPPGRPWQLGPLESDWRPKFRRRTDWLEAEFREVVYRVVNNVRRIQAQSNGQLQPLSDDCQEDFASLARDYDAADPRQQGFDDIVDWAASNVTSSGLGTATGNPEHSLTVIVQRRFEELVRYAQEGRFLAEAFIAPANVGWAHGDLIDATGQPVAGDDFPLLVDDRPRVEGPTGTRRGLLGVRFEHTRDFEDSKKYQHVYHYEMTWSQSEYRFDFDLVNAHDGRASFSVDRGFIGAKKRIGHPGETVISIEREAWLGGEYQPLNIYTPAVLRIQMFDALCVWLKDLAAAR